MPRARLERLDLPDFGMPSSMPKLPASIHATRLEHARARMTDRGYDHLVVYADREHSANLAHLSGFDPRFEEAVLILGSDGEPLLLAGNECVGLAKAAPLPMRVELWQDLSLPNQPRDRSRPLADILASETAVKMLRAHLDVLRNRHAEISQQIAQTSSVLDRFAA